MYSRRFSSLALLICLSSAHAAPQSLPLKDYVAGLKTIDAHLGERSLRLLFDTGGGGLILSPEVIEGACSTFGRVVGFRFNGERLAMPRCTPVSLGLGDWEIRGEAAVFDPMPLLGNSPKIDGILGLMSFSKQPFVLDTAASQLTLMSRAELARWVKREHVQEISIRVAGQAGGAALDVFVAIEAAPEPLWLELDSGNTGPVLLSPHALAQLKLELGDQPRPATLALHGAEGVEVSTKVVESIYDGLLSAEFVRSYVWAFDLERGRGWARRIVMAKP